jgi:hypothetical protein
LLLVLIQYIAASAVGRPLHFFTFGNKKQAENIQRFLNVLKGNNVTCEWLYKTLIQGGPKPDAELVKSPFGYVCDQLKK